MEKEDRKLLNDEKKNTKELLIIKREEDRIFEKQERKDINWKDMDAADKKNYWKKLHSKVDLGKKLRLKIKNKKRKRIMYKYI